MGVTSHVLNRGQSIQRGYTMTHSTARSISSTVSLPTINTPRIWWLSLMGLWLFSLPVKAVTSDVIFLSGFEDRPLFFPRVTSAGQEPVDDGDDAHAIARYGEQVSVVLSSGEARLDRTDFTLPGRGQLDVAFTRRHRSQLDYDGPLGHGWDFNYNERLQIEPNGDVRRSNGRGQVALWVLNPDDSYSAPAGYFGTLTLELDGRYLLRETDGFRRFYTAEGWLSQYQDRFGNTMDFSYDAQGNLTGITDVFGRSHELDYKYIAGRDRLVVLRDDSNRQWQYSYDANGHLVAVTTPVVTGTSTGNDFPAGRTEQYSYYDSGQTAPIRHNLESVTFPQEVADAGPAVIMLDYGTSGDALDRVVALTVGGINASTISAGGTAVINYQAVNTGVPLGDPAVIRWQVALTDRNGTQQTFLINELNHLKELRELTQGLRPGEPPDYYVTLFSYDADGQMTEKILPAGNTHQFTYDSGGSRAQQNNLLEIRQIADVIRGGGEDLVTTMTYEPVFNQLFSETGPRGNAATFIPPLGSASAARYTRQYFFDYQEHNLSIPDVVKYGINMAGIPRNLGDLNQDGLTNQLLGRWVRLEEPVVLLRADSQQAITTGNISQSIITEAQWNDRGQQLAEIDAEGNVKSFLYHPENDPDGDGQSIPGQSSVLPRGYLASSIQDSAPASNRRTAPVPPANLETLYGYDPLGNVSSRQDPRGVVSAFEYNALNELLVETRGANVDEAVLQGELITGETAFAYQHRHHYDHNGRVVLKEIQDEASVSATAGVGDWVEYVHSHDILNNLLSTAVEVDAVSQAVTQWRYDGNENLVLVTQPRGNQVSYEYDERNLLFREVRGFGTPDEGTIQFDYDLNGNVSRRVDAEDNDAVAGPEETLYVYDGFDRNTGIIDALGNQQQWFYDVASNRIRMQVFGHRANQPGAGNVLLKDEFYLYDELNRLFQLDQALFLAEGFNPLRPEDLRDDNSDGLVTEFMDYDALSRVTFTTEDDGDTKQTIYDGVGRSLLNLDPLGNSQAYTYDANSNVLTLTETDVSDTTAVADETFVTRYVYDQLNRLVRETDEVGRTKRYHYDSRDNIRETSDAQNPDLVADPWSVYPGDINQPGNRSHFSYDGRDLVLLERQELRVGGQGNGALDTSNPLNPDGFIDVSYAYDLNGLLSAVTDDNGNTTQYSYDARDRQIQKLNADGTTLTQVYDRDNNLIMITDPNGSVITQTFDGLNRLVQRGINRAAGVIGTTQETHEYDGLSRITQTVDNNGSASDHQVDRIYDSLNRLIEEQQDFEPYSNVLAGDDRRLSLTYPTSRIIEYSHDALNRVVQVVEPNPSGIASTRGPLPALTVLSTDWMGPEACSEACPCDARPLYMAMGNDTSLSFLDPGLINDVGYSAVREPIGMVHLDSGVPFIDRSYGYNRNYRRISELMTDLPGGPENLYALDSAYRSESTFIDDFGGETFSQLIEYQLDGAGNRDAVDFTQDFGGPPIQFSDNYTINNMNEYDSAGPAGPQLHDDNGNLTDSAGFLYLYDYRNRLVEVRRKSDNALRALYEYDTFNRRVQRTTYQMPTTTVDEERRYLYDGWHVIEEWASDVDYSNNGPIASYVYGAGIDQPTQMEASVSASVPGTFWFHRDVRNNVIAMTDELGNQVEQTRYDDFGQFEQSLSIDNRLLYQGRRYDPETGLFYFRNRYYNPATGRFLAT